MKKCPYCGAEYPDNAAVCLIDKSPLQSEATKGNSEIYGKNLKHSKLIGKGGHWLIFAGIPMSIIAILFVTTERSINHIVGQNAEPYVLFFVPALIMIFGMILYDRFPKRLVIQFGIIGWIINFVVLYWFFWFGHGAIGHH